jgi:hypothetical protein
MKRVSVVLVTAVLVLGWGCGRRSYEDRLDYTLEQMRYRKRLDTYLIPAPTDPKFKDFPLYIRPPKDMTLSTQFLMLNEADLQGQFDLAATFVSPGAGNLHVLARRKAAKKAPAKNAPEPAQPAEAQRPFDQEVTAILARVYPNVEAITTPKFDSDTKKSNNFKRLVFNSPNGNVVRVYLYKREPYEVALIWDTPVAQDRSTATARDLCLESFAVGRRAANYFGGRMSEGEGAEGGGGGGESAQPF